MTTKKTRVAKEVTEKRVVEEPTDADGEDAGVAPADAPLGIVAEDSAPVPHVQSAADHASRAAEDVRDAQVAEPNV